MNLGAFAVVGQLERTVGSADLVAARGLGRRAPWPPGVMTLCLLSLAGIPPLARFAGKVFLLVEAIDGAMAWLAILALVNFTVALYYYVRPVAEMYLRHPRAEASLPAGGLGFGLSYAIIAAGVLVLGILPGPPLAAIAAVARLLS